MNKGKAIIDGVTVQWEDSRRLVAGPPDDVEVHGEFWVTISADMADLDAVGTALIDADTLKKSADLGDLLCPHSDSRLRAVGLDDLGDVLIQTFRGDRPCDVVPLRRLAHIDPHSYAKDPVAEKSVRWMRDLARSIIRYREMLTQGASASELAAQWDSVRGADYFDRFVVRDKGN
jgi:hypothetical protein